MAKSSRVSRRISMCLLLYLLLVLPVLVDAQWTRLSEYIPSNSHSAAEQAQPLKRAAHSLAVFKDTLYVFGGIGDTNDEDDHEYDDTWKYEILNDRWVNIIGDREGSPTGSSRVSPQHRFHQSTAVHSNGSVSEMIVFGGLSVTQKASNKGTTNVETVVTQFNDVWRLSLQPEGYETWREDATLTGVRNTTGSGSSGSVSSPESVSTIRLSTTVPLPRSEAGAVVHDGQLYIFGGIAYDDAVDTTPVNFGDLWRYDLSNCSWTQILATDGIAPPARFSHSFSKFTTDQGETLLVVFSGRHLDPTSWSLLGDTWLFSLTTQRWRLVRTTPQVQRAYTAVVSTGGTTPKMWFFGGYFRPKAGMSGYVYDDVVGGVFDLSEADNTRLQFYHAVLSQNDAIPPLRYNHRAVLWRDSMIIHGGSYQSQRGDLWSFNLTSGVMRQDPAAAMPVNMETLVYVLAGFVFSIIVVLIVLVIRWRRIDRRNIELARMRGAAAVRGVTRERLDRMEVIKYKKPPQPEAAPPSDSKDDGQNNEDICPICLIEFEEDEDVRNLPCKHIFHVACIDEWLGRNTTCPMCKNNLDLEVVDVEILAETTEGRNSQQPPASTTQTSPLRPSTEATPEPRGGSVVTPVLR